MESERVSEPTEPAAVAESTVRNVPQRTWIAWLVAAVVFIIAASVLWYGGWRAIGPAALFLVSGLFAAAGRYVSSAFFVAMLIAACIFLPAMQAARPSIQRVDCGHNMAKIVFAIRDYHSDQGHYPPPFSTAEDGTPLHSWRVLILPYLNENKLYESIDLDKAWNDPANSEISKRMPEVYCCPACRHSSKWYTNGDTTAYIAVVGDDTMWPDSRRIDLSSVVDGQSNTILIAESEPHRLHWMSPDDPRLGSIVESDLSNGPHDSTTNIAMLDGKVISIDKMALSDFLKLIRHNVF